MNDLITAPTSYSKVCRGTKRPTCTSKTSVAISIKYAEFLCGWFGFRFWIDPKVWRLHVRAMFSTPDLRPKCEKVISWTLKSWQRLDLQWKVFRFTSEGFKVCRFLMYFRMRKPTIETKRQNTLKLTHHSDGKTKHSFGMYSLDDAFGKYV